MRIKAKTRKKLGLYAGLALALVLFFGYMGYKDLIFDTAAEAEARVTQQVAVVEKETAQVEKKPQEYYGLKRAEIALAEYRKGVIETTRGCNCGPEIDRYTEGVQAQWCTMFASWIAKEAGSPLYNEKTKSWRLINSRDFATNLQKNGTWYSREEIIAKNIKPKVGDFMVFWRGGFEDNLGHVDVVIDTEKGPGVAGLLGGNLKDRVNYRDFPYLQYYGFLGFGRPEKE